MPYKKVFLYAEENIFGRRRKYFWAQKKVFLGAEESIFVRRRE